MSKSIIIISSNPDNLTGVTPSHTVEAEYGETLVNGSETTLAHHGPRSKNPCPCLGGNLQRLPDFHTGILVDLVIGISHFDLDTLGGVMRCLGVKNYEAGDENLFWQVAAEVDVKGVHKLEEIRDGLWRDAMTPYEMGTEDFNSEDYFFNCWWDDAVESLNAFWAWSESHRLFPPRDGSVLDCTAFFTEAIRVVGLLIEGDDNCKETHDMYRTGKAWAKAKNILDSKSFVSESKGVILRSANQFTNHLYRSARAVVSFNSKFESVTLSLADPIPGVSCCDIAQKLWGLEAGGHPEIAGSPRGQVMTMGDAMAAADVVNKAIN